MSLEQLISENTAAIRELVAETKALRELRADAIEKVTATAASASKKTETKKEDAPKGNISSGTENRVEAWQPLADVADAYLNGSNREEERAARKEKIKKLLNHEQIKAPGTADGAGKFSTVREDAFDKFKDQIKKLVEKGDITTPPKAAASSDIDLD